MRPPRVDKEGLLRPAAAAAALRPEPARLEITTARLDGGGRDRATIVCGFLGLDARPFNPLLAAMPRVLHVSGATLGADSWVASFLRLAVVESNQRRPGGEAVLERMSEMLFVEVLRRYLDALPPGRPVAGGDAGPFHRPRARTPAREAGGAVDARAPRRGRGDVALDAA